MRFIIIFLFLNCFIFDVGYGIRLIDADFDFKISDIHRLIKSKKWNCTDVIHYFIERSFKYNNLLNAIINYNPKALEEAIMIDNYYYQHNQTFIGKLHCVPILVKDNIDVKGLPTTGGIKALRYSIPNIDAPIVEKLKVEGGIIIAKANMAELAAGKYESEMGGACKNPWDLTRTCGPSSSGIGAGIAAGLAIIGIGTDTEGSIMYPSTACNLFGFRPALGDLSMSGIIPVFEAQDTAGPISKHIDDIAISYSVMMGRSSIYEEYKGLTTTRFKIAYLKRFFNSFNISSQFGNFSYPVDQEVYKTLIKATNNLKEIKFEVNAIDIPEQEFKAFLELTVQIVISSTSAIDACMKISFNKYFQDKNRFDFDAPYKNFESFINSPQISNDWKVYFSSAELNETAKFCNFRLDDFNRLRKQYSDIFEKWFSRYGVEAFIFPTANELPYKFNETDDSINVSPAVIAPYLGYPSLNIPIGFSNITRTAPNGLPIGMLMLTKTNNYVNILKLGKLYEELFLKPNDLPKTTPLIVQYKQPCEQIFKFPSFSNIIKSSILLIFIGVFINVIIKH